MNAPRRPPTPPDQAVGSVSAWGPSPWLLAGAAALLGGLAAAGWLAWAPPSQPASLAQAPLAGTPHLPLAAPAASASTPSLFSPSSAAAPSSPSAPRIPRMRDPNGDLTPDLSDYVNEGERPTMAEVIDRLHRAGVRTGLGAFSPPGTRPPLIGLAVPEDFALPEGYVCHHQATDDGQRIEAILMFAPGFQLLGPDRRPIAMPADRVVPPELAPAGLPIRRIVVPAPLDSGRPGS